MSERTISFTLNGRPASAAVKSYDNVVDVLQGFDLRGARESCGQGMCGCCTVIVDGEPVSGCLYFAVRLEGRSVITVEHVGGPANLSDVQRAFLESGAFQCGFCTPGFVMMTHALLDRNPSPTVAEIKDHFAGNLCRCGAYPEIIEAVRTAAAARASKPAAAHDGP